ncbi:hypothetical protein RP20_CCG002693 [Aedes albopictus]|nr:hypothetical protein RP20_CCG002693 [Aedes albopictus]
MSREAYSSGQTVNTGTRSPGRPSRRLTELPTVDKSPSREYGARGSPLAMGSPYYRDMDEPISPAGGGHHRSRSATRAPTHSMEYPREQLRTRYQSLDRGLVDPHDREFIPIREPRDRSRDRSLERGLYLEEELYGRPPRQSPGHLSMPDRGYLGDLQVQNNELQRELGNLKKELDLTNQKLGSSMHSIKTFWSPELKKERALRKEESAKYSLINDQLKLLNSENQKQAMLVRQLEEELRLRMRAPNIEMQQQMEALYAENEHLQREISILRDTIKLDEFRLEIQRRDQEIMAMAAKMKTLEEQHQDYQRHIAVLKESLCAKEEHYNMLQADVSNERQI